jgi:ribonucleotide monophosphatase NagD (HAD superfamily)
LKKLGVSPEESVFVGDNGVADALGARNLGMSTVWMSWGRKVPPELLEDPFFCVATKFDQVPQMVRKLESLSRGKGSGYPLHKEVTCLLEAERMVPLKLI